jgi:hypothetical protein
MLRLMRGAIAAGLAAVAFGSLAGAAGAQSQTTGWDGTNPFLCTLQQVGMGTDFPDPDADPFCVEFDKTNQNVTEGGVVQFLSLEPARVAAASPKCFYFQRDHWRGSLIQGVPQTETYAWDGSYYFDKARGAGGVYVENFRIAGQTGDPTLVPGFPEEWKPYFSEGRGGIQAVGQVEADPRCAGRPDPGGPGGGGAGGGSQPGAADRCRVPGGRVGRGIGGVRLGMRRGAAKRALGLPTAESHRYVRWCLTDGRRLVVALRARGDRARVDVVMTDSPPFDLRGVRAGNRLRTAKRRLRGLRRLGRVRGVTVYTRRPERRRRVLVGVRGRRVAYVAITRRSVSPRRGLRYLRSSP